MRVIGDASEQSRRLSSTIADARDVFDSLPDLEAVREAAKGLERRIVGRCSFSRDYACSICERKAATADEIAHAPSCCMGNMLRGLKGRAV